MLEERKNKSEPYFHQRLRELAILVASLTTVTLLGIAGYYVLLGSDFLAITQVIIYVGGILVLLMFGILLTNRPLERAHKDAGRLYLVAALAGAALFFVVLFCVYLICIFSRAFFFTFSSFF